MAAVRDALYYCPKSVLIELPGPRTPLYPLIRDRVLEASRPLVDRLQAWRMMTANGLSTTDFNGKPVRYQGVLFEGSPRVVFWGGFFEPFLYDAARQTLEWVVATCRDRQLDPSQYLSEATSLIGVLTREAYEDMAATDQLLRGRGFPKSVNRTSVSHKIEAMTTRVEGLKAALIHRGEAAPPAPEILTLKLGIWGMHVDLKALWRRWLRRSV